MVYGGESIKMTLLIQFIHFLIMFVAVLMVIAIVANILERIYNMATKWQPVAMRLLHNMK